MSKKKNRKQPAASKAITLQAQPWISMRSGLTIIAIASLVMAGLTFVQVQPERGWLEAALWALLFGGLIWAIFWGYYFFRKIIH